MGVFKNYLLEQEFNWGSVIKELSLLDPSCNVLYRGIKGVGEKGIKEVRIDRQPKDTPEIIHKALNYSFNEKFGIKARSETLFCTKDKGQALEFSQQAYIIIPTNIKTCKVIYSNKIADLYTDVVDLNYSGLSRIFNNSLIYEMKQALERGFEEDSIKDAIKVQSYHSLSFLLEKLYNIDRDIFDKVIKNIVDLYKETTLEEYLKDDNKTMEGMVICNKYYFVSTQGTYINEKYKIGDVISVFNKLKEEGK